jgi:hypothetical protein
MQVTTHMISGGASLNNGEGRKKIIIYKSNMQIILYSKKLSCKFIISTHLY